MNQCERCGKDHTGEYGSGRFCSCKCAKGFSTKAKRQEISAKISATTKGIKKPVGYHPWKNLSAERKKEICEKNAENNRRIAREKVLKLRSKIQLGEDVELAGHVNYWKIFPNMICDQCGYEYNGEIPKGSFGPFSIHHIDGNKKNNRVSNLQKLCFLCHWKTDNFGYRGRSRKKSGTTSLPEVEKL